MEQATFEQLFAIGVAKEGKPYIEARQAVVMNSAEALPRLRNQNRAEANWTLALVTEAWITWITEPEVCRRVTQGMKGQFDSSASARPITGTWSPSARARGIAALGQTATPRILEILLKTKDHSGDDEQQALLLALGLLKDRKATLPLIALLDGPFSEGAKASAALALGAIGDLRATDPLAERVVNASLGTRFRSACARALGLIRNRTAVPALLQTFENGGNDVELRQRAVSALGALGDPVVSPILCSYLVKETNSETANLILSALETVGDRDSLAPIRKFSEVNPSETVRERAHEVLGEIVSRLNSRR